MLKIFNNFWAMCIAIIIMYYIIKTLFNLNKPIDHDKYLNYIIKQKNKCKNKHKLKKCGLLKENYLNFDTIKLNLLSLVTYFLGV
jgi:hypothetical protein